MDLSNVISSLLTPTAGSDVANAPDPGAGLLPSLQMPTQAPVPSAPQGSMLPPQAMAQAQAQGHSGDMLHSLMPLLIAAVTGFKNPIHGAAIAHGAFQGAQLAQQENLDAQQRDEQKRMLAGRFMQQTAADVLRLKDPMERQNYLSLADEIGSTQFGMPKGWTAKIPGHTQDDSFAALKTELAGKLQAFDKDKRWADVAGTPGEAKISFKLSNGQSVPVNMARQLVGQAVYDPAGQQAFPPETVSGKTEQERAAALLARIRTAKARGDVKTATELQGQYDDLLKAKTDTLKPPSDPNTIEGALMAAYRNGDDTEVQRLLVLKKKAGEAGRQQPITLNMPGMTPQTQLDLATDAVIGGRMAPSQATQIYGGRNKEFSRALATNILQKAPDFNFQAAESNYQYGKNVGVQSSVRFSKSVQESMPRLLQNAQTLANGNVRSFNALINAGKNQFNDVDLKRFQVDVLGVSDEIAKVLQGGGTGNATSDTKLKQAQQLLSTTDSPKAIAGALDELNTLLGFRIKEQSRGTFMEDKPPASKAALRYNPTTGKLEPNK